MLFIYSIIKILPFKKWFPSTAWKDIERLLLAVGVFGAFTALLTGETAEHLTRPNHQLVETHATFATLSTWIYTALLVGELASILSTRNYLYKKGFEWISSLLRFLNQVLQNKIISTILAIVGFVAISITGMLGGIMVYGLSADPVAPYLLKILNITLN